MRMTYLSKLGKKPEALVNTHPNNLIEIRYSNMRLPYLVIYFKIPRSSGILIAM